MDTYYHLTAARAIRENGFRIPGRLKEYALPGRYDYPPLYHYLLAMFPFSWHLRVERWSSAVMDGAHGLVIYAFSLWIFGEINGSRLSPDDALWISILFLMSPLLTGVGSGPRAYQGTPRTFGEFFFTLAISLSLAYAASGALWMLCLGAVFGGCVLLTSKFAAQVFFLVHLFFFIGSPRFAWIFLILLSVVFSYVLSFGHYKEILLGHWEHCRYYRKTIQDRFFLVFGRNRVERLKALPRDILRDPKRAGETLLMGNTYILFVMKNPQMFFLGYLALGGQIITGEVSLLLGLWIGATLLGFLMTSQRPFLFLGEAERYLEYSLFPGLLLLVASGKAFPLVYGLLGYEMVLYGIFVAVFLKQYAEKEKDLPEFYEMVAHVRSDARVRNILPLYLNDALHLAYETKKSIAHFPGNFRERYFPISEFNYLYSRVYPFANERLEEILTQFKFDTVFYSEKDLDKARKFGIEYDFGEWVALFANGKYRALQPRAIPNPSLKRVLGTDRKGESE